MIPTAACDEIASFVVKVYVYRQLDRWPNLIRFTGRIHVSKFIKLFQIGYSVDVQCKYWKRGSLRMSKFGLWNLFSSGFSYSLRYRLNVWGNLIFMNCPEENEVTIPNKGGNLAKIRGSQSLPLGNFLIIVQTRVVNSMCILGRYRSISFYRAYLWVL